MPAWAALADYRRWTDEQGCPVRVDVVADLFGPEHCGWQTVEFITIGEPFGTTIGVDTRLDTSRRFAWDPDGVLPSVPQPARTVERSTIEAVLDVIDTGYRRRGDELWLSVSDPTVARLVHGDQADVLQLDAPPLELCS